MRWVARFALFFLAGAGFATPFTSQASGGDPADFVAGELIVRFEPEAGKSVRAAALREIDAGDGVPLGLPGLRLVKIEDGPVPRAASEMARQPGVRYAEPNFIDRFEAVPDDVSFDYQWALQNVGQGIGSPTPVFGTPGADIDAVAGWDRGIGSRDVVIGIADTGVYYPHPDLAPNIYLNPGESGSGKESNGVDDDGNGYTDDFRGYDFFDGDNDPLPTDPPAFSDQHGTRVAGAAGARGDNAIGVSGVAQQTALLSLRVGGDGGGALVSKQIEAYNYAAGLGVEVVNLSASGPYPSEARLDAIRAAPDTLFVFAAGNDGTDSDAPATPRYPCIHNEPNVICVAATDQNDNLRSSSNFGKTTVDLAAPGGQILTTAVGTDPVVSYGPANGTSLASPIVAGAAAVYRSVYPEAGAAETREALLAGVDVLPSLAGKLETDGRLNLARTLGSPPPAPPEPPAPPSGPLLSLWIKAGHKQRVKKLKVSVRCGGVGCATRLSGKVLAEERRVKGRSRGARAARKNRRRMAFRMKPQTITLAAGQTMVRRIRFRNHLRAVRKLSRLLKKRGYREGTRAKLEVSVTGDDGSRTRRHLTIKLRR